MKGEIFFYLAQASSVAREVDLLFLYITAVSVFFSVLIAALVVGFVIRFRHSKDNDKGAPDGKEILMLEIVWSAIPLALSLLMFAWGAKLYIHEANPPPGTIDIMVVGKQWMWKLQHPDGKKEINELHVPVNRPVKLIMTSEDVIHSFFVPEFRMKADVLPERYTSMWFKATQVGEFRLFCAEYCGTRHAGMIGKVTVMPEAQYQQWLTSQGAGGDGMTLAQRGERLFDRFACQSCHVDAPGARGPSLVGVYNKPVHLQDGRTVVADETYLRESIVQPMSKIVKGFDPIMPTYTGQIDEESMLALIAYIKALEAKK